MFIAIVVGGQRNLYVQHLSDDEDEGWVAFGAFDPDDPACAVQIDREANDLYRVLLMKERVGESFDATITGVAEHGVYVTFEEPFVDARIPIDTLGEDWYELDSLGPGEGVADGLKDFIARREEQLPDTIN